jgi:pSer/pThr/pTyr-binding forkhead associated (FHA) protein
MPLNAKLVVVGGDVKTTEIALRLPSTIGRGRGTTIVLPHPLISRQHCELFEAGGQLMVRDLGSLNGTFVNNERVTEAPLAPGELLTVGTVTFRAVYEVADGPSELQKNKGDKTIKVTNASTLALKPKPSAPLQTAADSDELEFDFGGPLVPGEDELAADQRGGGTHVTERLDAAIADKKQAKTAEPRPAKSAAKPVNTKNAPAKGQDEEDKVASASDEDLKDFLDSLEGK